MDPGEERFTEVHPLAAGDRLLFRRDVGAKLWDAPDVCPVSKEYGGV
jgi:hypothetical protein